MKKLRQRLFVAEMDKTHIRLSYCIYLYGWLNLPQRNESDLYSDFTDGDNVNLIKLFKND